MKEVVAEEKSGQASLDVVGCRSLRALALAKLQNKCDDMLQFSAEGRHHRFRQRLPGEGAAEEERCLTFDHPCGSM
eukprot:12019970-Heterocapsa_arctica.AAC.1